MNWKAEGNDEVGANVSIVIVYRGENKGLFVLLSRTRAGPDRTVKQEQEEISRNHRQTFIFPSVQGFGNCEGKAGETAGCGLGRRPKSDLGAYANDDVAFEDKEIRGSVGRSVDVGRREGEGRDGIREKGSEGHA